MQGCRVVCRLHAGEVRDQSVAGNGGSFSGGKTHFHFSILLGRHDDGRGDDDSSSRRHRRRRHQNNVPREHLQVVMGVAVVLVVLV